MTAARISGGECGITRRQNSILRQAQDGDPDDPFTRALRATYNDLDAQRLTALSALATLNATDSTAPAHPDAAEVNLLDALPYLTANLTAAPEELLRRLFEATNLTVRLSDGGNHVASDRKDTASMTGHSPTPMIPTTST